MTRPGIEPQSPGPLVNTLLIRPMFSQECQLVTIFVVYLQTLVISIPLENKGDNSFKLYIIFLYITTELMESFLLSYSEQVFRMVYLFIHLLSLVDIVC